MTTVTVQLEHRILPAGPHRGLVLSQCVWCGGRGTFLRDDDDHDGACMGIDAHGGVCHAIADQWGPEYVTDLVRIGIRSGWPFKAMPA